MAEDTTVAQPQQQYDSSKRSSTSANSSKTYDQALTKLLAKISDTHDIQLLGREGSSSSEFLRHCGTHAGTPTCVPTAARTAPSTPAAVRRTWASTVFAVEEEAGSSSQ